MRSTVRRGVALLVAAGGVVALRQGTRTRKVALRRLHYAAGRMHGVAYRISGRQPDPAVPDPVLADRVRSVLGPVEKRLDVPHVHVMVEQHVALLHGDVGSVVDAEELEAAAAAVPGVRDVESHLHIGLIKGDTRPSAGHRALV